MENKFLNRVSELIQNKIARQSITAELESHILDKADYYEEIGYSREVAMQKATEEMGDPDDTAVPLNALHKSSVLKNIGTVLSAILIAFLFFLGNIHCDSFCYANNNLDCPHFVKYDFISLAIFAGYVLLLYFARRRKNKLILLIIIDSFAIQVLLTYTTNTLFQESIFVSDVTTLFQPLAYALVMIVTSGFSGYIDSIFSYSFIALPPEGTAIYKGIATTLFVFLVVWAIAVYVEISRQEKMKPTKVFRKPLKYSHYIVTVLLSLNFIVMSVGTAVAYSDIDYKINETQTVREHMIDCLLNAEISADYEEQLNYLAKSGYNATQDIRFDLHDTPDSPYVFLYNSNMLRLFSNENDDNYYSVDVRATSSEASIVEKALLCDSADREELSNYGYGTSLDEFIWSRIYSKAYEVQREFNTTDNGGDRVTFDFRFDESTDYEYNFVTFEDGELTINTAIDDVSQIKHTRQEIIDYICTDMYSSAFHAISEDPISHRSAELNQLGFGMTCDFSNNPTHYENNDDYNRLILDGNLETGDYYLKYYSTSVTDINISANDRLYFTEDEFDGFEKGMYLSDFHSPSNSYYWANAACVVSKATKFDEEKMEHTDRTISFIYAIKDDSSAVVNKYILEFKNGELRDKKPDGLFSEVYNELYY